MLNHPAESEKPPQGLGSVGHVSLRAGFPVESLVGEGTGLRRRCVSGLHVLYYVQC
jgi:hypothetical protein